MSIHFLVKQSQGGCEDKAGKCERAQLLRLGDEGGARQSPSRTGVGEAPPCSPPPVPAAQEYAAGVAGRWQALLAASPGEDEDRTTASPGPGCCGFPVA